MEEHKEQKEGTLHHSFRSESMLALAQGKAEGKPPEIEMKEERGPQMGGLIVFSLASYWMPDYIFSSQLLNGP